MIDYFYSLEPWIQALIATLFTWGLTALGASIVLVFKDIPKRYLNVMLAFSAGIMIAASIWSLIIPAIDLSKQKLNSSWIPATTGVFMGMLFILFAEFIADRSKFISKGKHSVKRSFLLVTSITVHNIPEGLAIGVAFAVAALGIDGATTATAIALAIGIGLQNLPEGAAVSLPLKREGLSNKKAFLIGQLSGVVEPFAGILGALLVLKMQTILPYVLSFAAGAMLVVVFKELIPSSQEDEYSNLPTIGFILGFIIMMVLDITL